MLRALQDPTKPARELTPGEDEPTTLPISKALPIQNKPLKTLSKLTRKLSGQNAPNTKQPTQKSPPSTSQAGSLHNPEKPQTPQTKADCLHAALENYQKALTAARSATNSGGRSAWDRFTQGYFDAGNTWNQEGGTVGVTLGGAYIGTKGTQLGTAALYNGSLAAQNLAKFGRGIGPLGWCLSVSPQIGKGVAGLGNIYYGSQMDAMDRQMKALDTAMANYQKAKTDCKCK